MDVLLFLRLSAGATFVARGYPVKLEHLSDLFARAILHEGFSIVDVLQPCVTFNNTYERYNESVTELEAVPESFEDSLGAARRTDRMLVGVMADVTKPSFHAELLNEKAPAVDRAKDSNRRKAILEAVRT